MGNDYRLYIAYVKKNPERHRSSAFKLWGGKIIAYIVLSFSYSSLFYYSLAKILE